MYPKHDYNNLNYNTMHQTSPKRICLYEYDVSLKMKKQFIYRE